MSHVGGSPLRTTAPAAAAPPVAHQVDVSAVGDPNVARIGGLVRSLHGGSVQSATLTLHPAELGEVRVELHTHDGLVSVHLAASHAEGADALRSATSSLRRDLESAGLGLGRLDVGLSGEGSPHTARDGADTSAGDTSPSAPRLPGPTRSVGPTAPATARTAPTGGAGLDLHL
jgi:hypothetical protein